MLSQRVLLRGVVHKNNLQILQIFVLWRLNEVVLHDDVAMNRKRIVVNRELLERCSVGVPPQLKAVPLPILHEVVSVLILRHEEVIVEAGCFEI